MTKTHFNSRYLGVLCFLTICGIIFHSNHDISIKDPSTVSNKPGMFTVSYVTSFWAKDSNDTLPNPHRREVEAALIANIHNRYFDQIVVFLDGATEQSNCIHFLEDMRNLHLITGLYLLTHDDIFAKVTCVDVSGSQPPYYQMFVNAVSDFVLGDVVVMANADQAFDYSVEVAHNLNPDVLVMLGTHGFSNAMPQIIKYFYETLAGTEYIGNVGIGKRAGAVGANICAESPFSWDTFIFHKNALKGRLKKDAFKRINMNNEEVYFYMNEYGAENAALWGLQQSFEFKSLYNACDRIHSWHFHLTPKTHKEHNSPWKQVDKSPQGSVPYPWGGYTGETWCTRQKCKKSGHPIPSKNPPCVVENNCFLVISKAESNTDALQNELTA